MNGSNSCYGGSAFDIYLAENTGYKYSVAFSVLSNEYCEMFRVDHQTKTISTLTKSGCCLHQFSTFTVENNVPQPLKVVEENYKSSFLAMMEVTETDYSGEKETVKTNFFLPYDFDGKRMVLSFKIDTSDKEIRFYEEENLLYYALLKSGDVMEFCFPQEYYHEATQKTMYGEFTLDKNANSLTCNNKDAQYEIYATKSETKNGK